MSQTPLERLHIAHAFTFELSKVETLAIRERMVAGLRNVDEVLAQTIADGLGLADMPTPLPAARPTRDDLKASPALSIVLNGPADFAGRKVGVLLSDGADAGVLNGLQAALEAEGSLLEVVAPTVGGVVLSDGTAVEGDKQVQGGPSVLFDAVVVLVSEDGAAALAEQPEAKDWVTDAYAHAKFVGYTTSAGALFDASGITPLIDDGFVDLASKDAASRFVECCRDLRYWQREASVS